MKTLSALHLVQFSFWDYETFNLRRGGTAFLGPNGAGKTSLADAVQIALVGAHGNHMHFNAQSVHRDHRSVRDYALGTMRSGEGDQGVLARKPDEALSYITLIFEGESPADVVSAGVCLHSVATDKNIEPSACTSCRAFDWRWKIILARSTQSSPEAFEFAPLVQPEPLAPAEADLDTVLQWLRQAHRPVLLGGSGVHVAGARTEFLALAESLGLPVCTAWTHDLIASDHPLFAGRPGTIGTRAGNLVLQQADLVLVIGSRLNIRQASYNWASFASRARIVMVDVDAAEQAKPLVRPALAVQADARVFLQRLLVAIEAAPHRFPSFAPWRQWCRDIGARFPAREAGNVSVPGLIRFFLRRSVFSYCLHR